ncbi:hypothetical protein BTO04_12045 [Polaribacter sp. SA4-10]|uniref:T9SS type A sorting domain-containing protein n=1 Tax=Polaribacter sp. SA4-10 TaxID=754397 RepID=UPI000B3C2ACE|nr:T9SS type A sorting domain-containing protein [Polaribacter sp. SA4-10]ARV07373.1 hypothetical protein BTO04_12045 [Polaribacter sp. SA4-10]
MKKIIILIVGLVSANVAWSQDLHVGSGAAITTLPGSVLFSGSNTSVDASASLTTTSDATVSGSFIVSGTTTGDITYKRYIPDTDWHLVSAPVTSQSIPTFVGVAGNAVAQSGTTSNYGVSYYNNTNAAGNRWTYHNTATTAPENQETLTNFVSGQGYSMKKAATGAYTFTGAMANTDVAVSIPTVNAGTHRWSCIGNPFPSFLAVNNAANAVANVLTGNLGNLDPSFAFLYVWNGTSYDPIGLSDTALQLAPGQAFMVKAINLNETFTFSKGLQNHNSGPTTFYKGSSSIPTILVNLTSGAVNKATKLTFLDSSTTGLDVGYDAGAYQDGTPSFSINTHLVSDSQGIDFTRQSLPTSVLDSEVAIPLSVYAAVNKKLTFSVAANNVPDGVAVYLEDSFNNTFTNLTDASVEITTTTALNGIGRFYLRTSSSVLSLENNVVDNSVNLYKTSNSTLKITGLKAQGNATLQMYNIGGKEVLATQFVAQRVKEISLPMLPTGVYIVSVVSKLGTFHKKLIIE